MKPEDHRYALLIALIRTRMVTDHLVCVFRVGKGPFALIGLLDVRLFCAARAERRIMLWFLFGIKEQNEIPQIGVYFADVCTTDK